MQQQQVRDFYDPKREPLRGETRAELEVTVTGMVQLGDNAVPPGTHRIIVWERQVELFEQLVEDDHVKMKLAIEIFERELFKKVANAAGEQAQGLTSLAELRRAAKSNAALARALEVEEARTGDSPQAQFQKLADRAPTCITAVKVLRTGIPEPGVAMKREAQVENATAIGDALAQAFAPILAELKARPQPAASDTQVDAKAKK